MKSFLNYSKNRFLYSLFKFGLILLALYLGKSLFGFIPVYAYSTSGFTYASQVYVAGIVNDSEYVGNACTSGDFCAIQINGEAETQIFRAYYNSSFSFTANKTYNLTFMVADTCTYFGTENGEKWYVRYGTGTSAVYPEMTHTSCTTHEDGYSTIKLTFKSPSTTTLSQINISHSYPGYLVFPIHNYNVAFSRFYKLEEVTDFSEQIYNEQQQTNEKLDDLNDKQEESNQIQSDIKDSLTDTTPPDLNGLSDSAGWLPAGPVDSILNLPISLLNNLNDNLGGTCQPVTLTLPYVNKDITLPCMSSIYETLGITVWVNSVGTIAAAFIGYYYLLELYKWVDNVLTMRENQWNDVDQWGGI